MPRPTPSSRRRSAQKPARRGSDAGSSRPADRLPSRRGRMTPSELAELRTWLLTTPHVDDGGRSLMTGLVDAVRGRGVPLWRCSFSLLTKHPELVWRTVQWSEETGVRTVERSRVTLDEPFFTRSPVALLRQGAPPIRV